MITAPELEIAVLVLGMAILLAEAFVTKIDKRALAFVAIAGLALVLAASFFVVPSASTSQVTGFWSFYTADRLSIFFKQFALVTTIFVLILMTDYAPVLRNSFPGTTPQAGLGEFFALPIFTCVGLMYLVSAIDFVFIFVSLELVTISFYVLVSFTRRNPIDFGSRNEIPRAERPFDGVSRVWDRVDFRRDRSDKSASNRRRTRESSDRPKRSLVRYGASFW